MKKNYSRIYAVRLPDKKIVFSVISVLLILSGAFAIPFGWVSHKVKTSPTIVIDAGHGGIDGGVTGVKTGVRESDLNLHIALYLGEMMQSAGYRVVYTRKSDKGLYSSLSQNKKRDDMQKRVGIMNGSKPDAVISVHMNFFGYRGRRGAQVFFGSEKDKEYADIMQETLNTEINSYTAKREYDALKADKYLLNEVNFPIIIVECGFLSSPFDEENLVKPEYQLALATTLFKATTIYLSNKI